MTQVQHTAKIASAGCPAMPSMLLVGDFQAVKDSFRLGWLSVAASLDGRFGLGRASLELGICFAIASVLLRWFFAQPSLVLRSASLLLRSASLNSEQVANLQRTKSLHPTNLLRCSTLATSEQDGCTALATPLPCQCTTDGEDFYHWLSTVVESLFFITLTKLGTRPEDKQKKHVKN